MPCNYRYLRSKLKTIDVEKLPNENWLTVSQAAKKIGVSKQTIRHKYLRGEIEVIRLKKEKMKKGKFFVKI